MTPKLKNGETENHQPETLDDPGPIVATTSEDDNDTESQDNCECCRLLQEEATPIVSYVNISKSDVIYDRTLHLYKLERRRKRRERGSTSSTSSEAQPSSSSSSSNNSDGSAYPPPVPAAVNRQLDRFEESKIWDIVGLTSKMYAKLPAELKKCTPKRLVFKKCAYRLHNTRHFQVPLTKKGGCTKEEVLKQKYEDDRKLLKKNQAFNCPWNECPHSFQDPQDMRIHYMFDHESIKLFCCGNRFENYDSYMEHYCQSQNGDGHATWMARECWGCGIRYVDAMTFYHHAERCDAQINPFPCPDPLCGIRFEILTDVIDHFFIWHDKSGAIVCNDVIYRTRESIDGDLQLFDDGQLVVNYPLRATYICQLCQIQFATETLYAHHVAGHVKNPHLWLFPTILYCDDCQKKNCPFQRQHLIQFLPKIIDTARNLSVEKCETDPIFLIWRLFLSEEYIKTLEMILVKLVSEHRRLQPEEEFLDLSGHAEIDDKRILYILNSLLFVYTVPYRSDQEILARRMQAWPAIQMTRDKNGERIVTTE